MRKATTIIISFILIFSLVSSSGGFDSNKENFDPTTKEPIAYTAENINSGKIKGGHDTITAEGMLLKEQVHQRTDADGGIDFRNKMVRDALPNLRTGAHDEDSTKTFGIPLSDPPIGPNGWGNFFEHFYTPFEPGVGSGLNYWWNPATQRARDYIKEVKKLFCKQKKTPLTDEEKKKLYDLFGRISHLLQDMAMPSHTKNDIHVFIKPFEDYVNNHWNDIVNSDVFKSAVTPEKYLEGNYGNLPNIDNPVFNPDKFMEDLANKSNKYSSEEELIDLIIDPDTGNLIKEVNMERLMRNVNELIPEAVKHTAGYINAVYNYLSSGGSGPGGGVEDCDSPPDPPNPANDHPDDRFDVSDEFYWEREFKLTGTDLTDLYLRTAIKKGKIGVWYKKRFMEIFVEGRTKYQGASNTVFPLPDTQYPLTAYFLLWYGMCNKTVNSCAVDVNAKEIALTPTQSRWRDKRDGSIFQATSMKNKLFFFGGFYEKNRNIIYFDMLSIFWINTISLWYFLV
jgi:hypothetical protein